MATMDEFWGTRDFCLIPVMNPKRETAPAALIFFSTIEKTTSYDELCEMDDRSQRTLVFQRALCGSNSRHLESADWPRVAP